MAYISKTSDDVLAINKTKSSRVSVYRSGGKRVFDLLFLITITPIVLPVIAVLALLVKRDGGPAFYKHRRVGRNGHEFDCIKIRTMVIDSERRLLEHLRANPDQKEIWERDFKLENDPRITRVGNFLRKTSLDELPQFLNVFRGELSIVGPRPVTQPEIVKYGEAAHTVLQTQPGVTGLWQVSGRNDISYSERVSIDLDYCRNISLLTDIKIIVKTVLVVLVPTGK